MSIISTNNPREVAVFDIALTDFLALYRARFPSLPGSPNPSIAVTLSAPGLDAAFSLSVPVAFSPASPEPGPGPGGALPG